MNDAWYYGYRNQQVGPVSRQDLLRLLASGQLPADTLVWTDGMTGWQAAHTVGALSQARTPVQQPPPPSSPPQSSAYVPTTAAALDFGAPAMEYAGFWRRHWALWLDGFIVGTPFTLLSVVVMAGAGAFKPTASTEEISAAITLATLLLTPFSILANWLYFALMESSKRQATFGKSALGIMVKSGDGQRVTFGQASGRHFGKIVSCLVLYVGFFMVAFTHRKRALHDMMSNCVVMRRR